MLLKRFKPIILIIAFILSISSLTNNKKNKSLNNNFINKNLVKALVINVIDGDTLLVNIDGNNYHLRLIGIDAPESRENQKLNRDLAKNNKSKDEIIKMGQEATNFVKNLLKDNLNVTVEFDVVKTDKYGRLLGYVYLSSNKMLNEEILKNGYANLLTIPPNIKYEQRFLKAYRYAYENRLGLFKK